MEELLAALNEHADTCKEAKTCVGYVERNLHRMRYLAFEAMGLCTTSNNGAPSRKRRVRFFHFLDVHPITPLTCRTDGAIWLMSTPSRQAGIFYNIWHNGDQHWRRISSTVKDCPEINPDFLEMQKRADEIRNRQDFEREFFQPADRMFTEELLDSITR